MTQTELFARDYLGKLFYFCLKKTGDRSEAEELAGDIALSVVESLAKYPPPEHFSAWVWKIAGCRYARWAESRHRQREHIALPVDGESDGGQAVEPASDESVEDALLAGEQYSLLRRELAFISREYRELLVAHYINDTGIGELSRRTGIPQGTIKTRLMRARKILKEGMDMAREFGIRSYNPEDVSFTASGNQPDGLPWSAVERKIPKNILLEASNNLSGAEELSMELGIALPYMEDEIDALVRATLLEKVGDKYITSFFIADKQTQLEVYNAMRRGSKERSRLLAEAIGESYDKLRELVSPTCPEEDFKWFLYVWLANKFIQKISGYGILNVFKRSNGGNWGFCGFEQHDLIGEDTMVNHNICCGSGFELGQYAVMSQGIRAMYYDACFNNSVGALLTDMLVNGRGADSITDSEGESFRGLTQRFAHIGDGGLVPDIVVLRPGIADKVYELVSSHPSGRQFGDKLSELFGEVRRILERNTNEVLHKTLNYYVSMFLCNTRGMLMNDEVDSGVLKAPDKPEASNAGVYLEILA